MVDREELKKLLRHKHKNRQRIREIFYDLANIVAAKIDRQHADDLRPAIYLKLDDSINKFRPARGDAYSYFYKIAQHEALHLIKGKKVESIDAQDEQYMQSTKDLERVTASRRKQAETMTGTLDLNIRRTRDEVRKIAKQPHSRWGSDYTNEQITSREYIYVVTGLTFLQELRKQVLGSYLTASIPTHTWRGTLLTKNECENPS